MFGLNAWVILIVVVLVLALAIGNLKRRFTESQEEEEEEREQMKEAPSRIPMSEREDDALYQYSTFFGERRVARAVAAEIDEPNKEIRFVELVESDKLLLPEECDFRKFKIQIHTVEDAVKVDKEDPERGRILRNVTAEIKGYVEH